MEKLLTLKNKFMELSTPKKVVVGIVVAIIIIAIFG